MRLVRLLPPSCMTAAISVVALVIFASTAGAFNPRIPQVVVNGGSLQGYFNGIGESINVLTDQLDAQVWTTSVSGNSELTLMIELAGFATSNAIGIYNGNGPVNPPLYQIFPGAATAGWFATAHFGAGGSLVVTLFDNNSVIQGQSFYAGVNQANFGFYLQGPGGTFYSQDSRNGGSAKVLTYAGTGVNFGEWWECFEDLPAGASDDDFDDAVVLVQSVAPTPTHGRTWGTLKAMYR